MDGNIATCNLSDGNVVFLSIVVDDFDSKRCCERNCEQNCERVCDRMCEKSDESPAEETSKSFQKILEEAEHRKNEFWKLIEEHNEVIENLKKIEGQGLNKHACKTPMPRSVST